MINLPFAQKEVLPIPEKPSSTLPELNSEDFLPPSSRWLTIAGFTLTTSIIAAISLAAITKYNVTVKADATVRPAGDVRLVQSELEGTIKQVVVKENQSVKRGDVLAVLDDGQFQIKKSQLENSIQQLRLQQSQIDAQLQTIQMQIQAEQNFADRSVSSAQADLARNERELSDRRITTQSDLLAAQATMEKSQADLQKAQTDLKFAMRERDRYQQLLGSGAISQRDFDQKQQTVQQSEAIVTAETKAIAIHAAKIQAAEVSLNPSHATVTIAQQKISQEAERGEATIAGLQKDRQGMMQRQTEMRSQLQQQQKDLQQVETQLSRSHIRATQDGVILKLNLRNVGQFVRSGEEIVQISPSESPLLIKATVALSDIQKVAPGQQVQLKVSACPYPDYGVLLGTVKTISPDAVVSSGNGSYFEVTIQPNTTVLKQETKECSVQAGMSGKVDIISQEDTVLKFLLRQARLLTDL